MPLFWLALAFLAGILFANAVRLPATAWLIMAGAAFAGSILLAIISRWLAQRGGTGPRPARRLPAPFSLAFGILFFASALFGAYRYQSKQPDLTDPSFIAWYNGTQGEVILEGVIAAPPDVRDSYTNLRLAVDKIRPAYDSTFLYREAHGSLLVKVPAGGTWRYGDRVHVEGQIEAPPEDEGFSYRDYLARQGIYSTMSWAEPRLLRRDQGSPVLATLYRLKERALATVYRIFPDPEASLLAGILLGVETGISSDVQEAFKTTGTSHIIAISGFNIGIIAGLFTLAFSRLLGRRWGAVAAMLGIGLYTVLVGPSPSVLRAAIMGCFALVARQLGRQTGINTLAITAAVMAGSNPSILWDPGFQLSFAATLGLVLYADPLQTWFTNLLARRLPPATARRIAGPIGSYLLFTLAAQGLTLPIIAYHFARISLVSIIANPVVLPAQPPLMILGGLAVLLGSFWQPLGQVLATLAWPFIAFTIRAVEWFATFPGGSFSLGSVSLAVVLAIYLLILALTVWKARFREKLLTLSPVAVLTALGVSAVFVWRAAFSATDGRLHITILDVSAGALSGDGILIRTPSGRNLLIDGGPSATRLSEALGRRLPPTGRDLDWLVVATPGDGQTTSLPQVLDRFRPANVLWAGPTHGTYGARELQAALVRAGISPVLVQSGQALDLGDGAVLRVLTVGPRGATLLLEWDRFRLLLPLGANLDDLESLEYGKAVGNVSALLLADSGYAPINPPEWIGNLRPEVVLLSVSAADREELPSPETLELLQGYTVLRTDRNGWLELSTDGEQMWVEVERR
jgi:competence protein ComEC